MKKLSLLASLLLAVFGALFANAQDYKLGDEVTSFEPDSLYIIMNASRKTYLSCKTGDGGGLLNTLKDADVVWQIEDSGEKTPAGFTLYYLKSVGGNGYVQEVDFESNPDKDGFDMFSYQGFNFALGPKQGAAKLTIEQGSRGTESAVGEAWRTNTASSTKGFVIARNDSVINNGSAVFMKFGVQNTNVAFEPYNQYVAWKVYKAVVYTYKMKLQDFLDQNSGSSYLSGTEPGFYGAKEAEAYDTSLQSALTLLAGDASEDQLRLAYEDLTAKHDSVEASLVPITDGYYYIVSGFDDFLSNVGVEKAAYCNTDASELYYKTFDATDIDLVFHIWPNQLAGKQADEYWIQGYSSDLYVSRGERSWGVPVELANSMTMPQRLQLYDSGKWFWTNRYYRQYSPSPYTVNNPTAADDQGVLTTYGKWDDDVTASTGVNLWYVRRVSDEQMAQFTVEKAQIDRTREIENLASEGNAYYSTLFAYLDYGEEDEANSQYYQVEGMQAAADKMQAVITQKEAIKETATDSDIAELRSAVDAVKALYVNVGSVSQLISQAQSLASTAVVGEQIGDVPAQSVIDSLNAAVNRAQTQGAGGGFAQQQAALNTIQDAIASFYGAMHSIDPDKYYYIITADKSVPEKLADGPIYMPQPNSDKAVNMGFRYSRDVYPTNGKQIFRFIPTGGKDSINGSNTYIIQNMANGFYLSQCYGDGTDAYVSNDSSEYVVRYSGNGTFTLISNASTNPNGQALGFNDKSTASFAPLRFMDETPGGATSWYIREMVETDAIINDDFYTNAMDIMTLPYNISMLSEINENFHIYGIRKMSQQTDEQGQLVTTIELYEKQSAQAGEPVLYVQGTQGETMGRNNLLVPVPSQLSDKVLPANGLVGTLLNQTLGSEGVAYSDGTKLIATTEAPSISYRSGIIDPAGYQGEIDSLETALTLTVVGLKPLPTAVNPYDVNHDGQVNSSDVVAVYNYISDSASSGLTLEQADVNEDGQVNSSDAVAIYNQIAGQDAASKGFSTLLKLQK